MMQAAEKHKSKKEIMEEVVAKAKIKKVISIVYLHSMSF